jgi:hypothetical protein
MRELSGMLCLIGLAMTVPVAGQSGTPREIARMDFSATGAEGLPAGVGLLRGRVAVVVKDGARMLKASTPTEFLLTLPEALPSAFTLEFDLVPRAIGSAEDLAFEGTATLSESSNSAHVFWGAVAQRVSGGGPVYQSTTPGDIADASRSQLTRIVVTVEGETLKLYTNGRRLYTLTERRFARGRVLRVFLGGQNEDDQAVYLAGIRVLAGIVTPAPPAIAVSGQSASTGTLSQPGSTIRPVGSAPAPATVSGTTPVTSSVTAPAVSGASATGPVETATSRTLAESRATLLAPPAQRSVRLSGFTGGGPTAPPSRRIALAGFNVGGTPPVDASRVVRLSAFTGTGGLEGVAQRTLRLDGFAGTGLGPPIETASMPALRTIRLSSFTASGGVVPAESRSIRLTGFAAAGQTTAAASRRITLGGFTWNGGAGGASPRVLRLSEWTASGPTTTP